MRFKILLLVTFSLVSSCVNKKIDSVPIKNFNSKKEYYKEIRERFDSGELLSMDSLSFPDSLTFTTMGGRTVFGGGGIVPDYFVPIDTSGGSDYYCKLIRKGELY